MSPRPAPDAPPARPAAATRARTTGLALAAAGAAALALTVTIAGPACAAGDSRAPAPRAAETPPAAITAWPEPVVAHELTLRRAARAHDARDHHGVVDLLETIDFSTPLFVEADRAAFLLGHAYLELGSVESFEKLAARVARWDRTSHYTEWIGWRSWLSAIDSGARERAVLQSGPLTAYLGALARESDHQDAAAAWTALAERDTATALGRDLAGGARLRLASLATARGEDPRPVLAGVSANSRFGTRARHLSAVASLERGESERARRELEVLIDADPSYSERRAARLALAGIAMDEGRWADASAEYERANRDWTRHREVLDRLAQGDAANDLWWTWERNPEGTDLLTLDASAARAAAVQLADAITDLGARPTVPRPDLGLPAVGPASPWTVSPPPAAERAAVGAASRQASEATYQLERTRRAIARERAALDERRRYLEIGAGRNAREADTLAARAASLDAMREALAALEARLRAVRDDATRRMLERSAAVLEDAARHQLWIAGMRRFHTEGPEHARARSAPPGLPSAEGMLAAEDSLAAAISAAAQRMAAEVPDLIARSHDQAWAPQLAGRAIALGAEAHALLEWSQRLASTIDSSRAAATGSPTLQRLEARAVALARAADSLRAERDGLRVRIARAAVERARAAIETEREAIDYGLASAAYAWSTGLPREATPENGVRAVALGAGRRAAPSAGAAAGASASPADGDPTEDPAVTLRREVAIARLRAFLQRHDGSFARGEMRFRLADLLLVDARHRFRERMARFVRAQEEGRLGTVDLPILDHGIALDLYRKILAEDRTFERRDAVWFNGGMILADAGDPEAERWLEALVKDHPASPDLQHGWLRLADLRFDRRRHDDAVPAYTHAAAGPDPGLRAIALYKLGWSHFERERYALAAGSFGAVLDLYGAEPGLGERVSLEREAETYLVHAIARAGGAPAYARHFDRAGDRPYAIRVLLALGQHLRRWQLHDAAAAADELCLARHPLRPEALVAAQRLADMHRRAGRVSEARRVRLEIAPRFAPGRDWARAQDSDSLRAAGVEFARGSWLSVAAEDHALARRDGAPEDWRGALARYELLLATFPSDPQVPTYHLHAGEALLELGRHGPALAHYDAAAAAGSDSVASHALWQRMVVRDDAYRRATKTADRESAATAVIAAGDAVLARFSDHPHAASIRWRQGNLALAHGALARAATDFEALARRHPGDGRAPFAAALRADALFRLGHFDDAGAAYEAALAAARTARNDSLARRAAAAVPVSYERAAEAAIAADSSRHAQHAQRFRQVAERWPDYERAHAARYRAGLSFLAAGDRADGVREFEALIRDFPRSEYVRDAHLQIAHAHEAAGDRPRAAQAYRAFSERFADDGEADDAWLRAADLTAAAGDSAGADELRGAYLARWPDDVESAMEILEPRARRELAGVGPGRPVSSLLDPAPARRAKSAPAPRASAAKPAPPRTSVAAYLRHARVHPEWAARDLLAQVRFLQGEEAAEAYAATVLRLPLEKSIAAKQLQLDSLVATYRRAVDLGASEWAHAATFRIGEALLGFGEALERSERPRDLAGDDRIAYEDVLLGHRDRFFDRGEKVWMDLLRAQPPDSTSGPWVARARDRLWARLGQRFYFRPEVEHPLASVRPAERRRPLASTESEER